MLTLSRHPGESIILDTAQGRIYIYFDLKGNDIKVGIEAPRDVSIVRDELVLRDSNQCDTVP